MKSGIPACVILFNSVNRAMWAKSILKKNEIPHKLIPVPRQISSDCGVCIRFDSSQKVSVLDSLSGIVEYSEIREL